MRSYPHMCRDDHVEIGHFDSEYEQCPVCRATARAEQLRLELEKIAWLDEFLDAAGARAMMNIAREAVQADEAFEAEPAKQGQ